MTKLTAELDIQVNPLTGLPMLPEGFIWRITKTVIGDGLKIHLIELEVSEKFLYFFKRVISKEAELGTQYVWDHELEFFQKTWGELLLVRAKEIITGLNAEFHQDNKLEEFVGDYPPKSL